jgi:hypothetical protein
LRDGRDFILTSGLSLAQLKQRLRATLAARAWSLRRLDFDYLAHPLPRGLRAGAHGRSRKCSGLFAIRCAASTSDEQGTCCASVQRTNWERGEARKVDDRRSLAIG